MIKYFLVIISLAFLFVIGCGEGTGNKPVDDKNKFAFDSSDIKITPVNETNSFNIRYNFQKGETYKYRVTTISSNKQLISGDTTINNYMKQTLNYLVDLTVDKVETDSVMEISCNIHSFKIDADLNGDTIYYESGITKDSTIEKDIAQYQALLNNPFGVRISNKGEILEIFRVDKIVTTLIDKAGYGDSLTAENKVTIKESITSGLLKPLLMQIMRELPAAKVAKDSTWEFLQEKSQLLVFQIGYKTKYALKNIGMYDSEKLAEIDGSLETEITGDTKLTEGQINYEFQKPITWANGKIYFNLEKGCVQKSRTNTKMELNYSMQMPDPKGIQKANRNETVTTTNIVELL